MAQQSPRAAQAPFPISCIASRYLVFDVDDISHARREHRIAGVLIGTLPRLPQQNVFLGVPLELMPEEARVLVETGAAYIVDDVAAHRDGGLNMTLDARLAFLRAMDERGLDAARAARQSSEARSEKALQQRGIRAPAAAHELGGSATPNSDGTSVAASVTPSPGKPLEPYFLTPTTSYPPLTDPSAYRQAALPVVPPSYPLFRHLHAHGFFLTPGLRFGCHYSVYPGDPLRFHSHFLATGLDWDAEFDLLDVVGGGRLGTGVKKAYLIGGQDQTEQHAAGAENAVRAFSIEWAGM